MVKKYFGLILLLIIINYQISLAVNGDSFFPDELFNKETVIEDTKTKIFDDSLTSKDIVDEMGLGWNLGNTLDAWDEENKGVDSETSWGNPKTTKNMIKEIAKKGFKTIRIPTTWKNHLIDKKYTIDPEWMKRVKEIVDWCIENDLYVILNDHHDNADLTKGLISYGKGYFPLLKDVEESKRFLFNIWRQITIAFNQGYDHHLIFEPLNEPRLKGHQNEWNFKKDDPDCEEACEVLNQYLDLIVQTIRESGGNNYKRFIMITPLSASFNSAMNSDLIFPTDYYNRNNKLILSVHMYDPYDFTMSKDLTLNVFKDEYKSSLEENFIQLYNKFIREGYSIIIGEFDARNKNNLEERIKWGDYYIKAARRYGISCVIWDNGIFRQDTTSVGSFYGLFHREDLSWETDELVDTYIEAAK